MSNTNPHDEQPIDAGYFYCPYVPLQTSSVHGTTYMELGVIYGGTVFNNIHDLMAHVIRREWKYMKDFAKDMRPW